MTPPLAVDDLIALDAVLDRNIPVRPLLWRGQPAWGKRRMPLRLHERVLLTFSPLLRRWLAPDFSFSARRYGEDLPVEVQRLRELASMGWNVPAVLAAKSDLFVTADAGPTLVSLLKEEPDNARRAAWLLEAARDLAAFHSAGQWHGAAQIRNVVRTADGRLGRIDFETSLDTYLPLPLLQAFDAALFLTSIVRSRDRDVLPAVARAYSANAPMTARIALSRGLPLVRRLARSAILGRLFPKEAERLRVLAALPFDLETPASP